LTGRSRPLLGPRTLEQLDGLRSGGGIELSSDILDPADNHAAVPPSLENAELRRW
jgi:hypothetical protein